MGWIVLLNLPNYFLNEKKYFLLDSHLKFFKQGWIMAEKKIKKISFKFIRNMGNNSFIKILTKLRILFSNQLPNIPLHYIEKQLLDKKHIIITLIEFTGKKKKIIGSCCFRIFEVSQFIELIFFAVSTKTQGLGYGTYLMSCLKDFARSIKIKYIITCADNNAVTFFLKQGFSSLLTSPVSLWFRHIKEYEEIELMECVIWPKNSYFFSYLNFILQKVLFLQQQEKLFNPTRKQAKKENLYFNLSAMISEKSKKKFFHFQLFNLVDVLRSDKYLAPFLEPIDTRKMGVGGYYQQFVNSIDIRSIEEKIRSRKLILKRKIFLQFIKRMINNSALYNGELHSIKEICNRLRKILHPLKSQSF